MTWSTSSDSLNQSELAAFPAYVAPKNTQLRTTFGALKDAILAVKNGAGGAKRVEETQDPFAIREGGTAAATTTATTLKGKGKKTTTTKFLANSVAVPLPYDPDFDCESGDVTPKKRKSPDHEGAEAESPPPPPQTKKTKGKGSAAADAKVMTSEEIERLTTESLFETVGRQPGVAQLLATELEVVVVDAMCALVRVLLSLRERPFDLVHDENNEQLYAHVAREFVRIYYDFFPKDAAGEIRGGMLVLCADIQADNELRRYQTNRRDEEKPSSSSTPAVDPAEEGGEEGEEEGGDGDGDDGNNNYNNKGAAAALNFPLSLFTVHEAYGDRTIRYTRLLPGILRAFYLLTDIPQNLFVITRGFKMREKIRDCDDKTKGFGLFIGHNSPLFDRMGIPIDDLDGQAAMASQEADIASVSIGFALAKPGVARKIFRAYFDPQGLIPFPEEPNVCLCSVDGDIYPSTLACYHLYPQPKVYLSHSGNKSTVKTFFRVADYYDHVVAKYRSANNYIALVVTGGNDYCGHVNGTSPLRLGGAFVKTKPKDILRDTAMFMGGYIGDQKMLTMARWWSNKEWRDLTNFVGLDPLYPVEVNHLYMIGLLIRNKIITKAKNTTFEFICRCDPDVPSLCGCKAGVQFDSKVPTLHNLLNMSATVQSYLNYLHQQFSLEIKNQPPVCNLPGGVVTGFYKDQEGVVRMGIRCPIDYDTDEGRCIFGEEDDTVAEEGEEE